MSNNRENPICPSQAAENTRLNRKQDKNTQPNWPVFGLKCAIFPVNSLKAGKPNRLHSAQRQPRKLRPDIARDGSKIATRIQVEPELLGQFRSLEICPDKGDKCRGWVAERQGFEPWVLVRAQRFSRPPRSTTPASLRILVCTRSTQLSRAKSVVDLVQPATRSAPIS